MAALRSASRRPASLHAIIPTNNNAATSSVDSETEKQIQEAQGSFTAPFDGTHGWYWRNRTKEVVTVTLRTEGTAKRERDRIQQEGERLKAEHAKLQPAVEQAFSNTTARDLVSALSDLLNVQNDFLSVWVNYELQRRFLDLDLGTKLPHQPVQRSSLGRTHVRRRDHSEGNPSLPHLGQLVFKQPDPMPLHEGTEKVHRVGGRQFCPQL